MSNTDTQVNTLLDAAEVAVARGDLGMASLLGDIAGSVMGEQPYEDGPRATPAEMLEVIRDAMWTVSPPSDSTFTQPAERWLPRINEAERILKEVFADMYRGLPPDAAREVKMASAQNANPLWELASQYPEIARLCCVELALFGVGWVSRYLKLENQSPVTLPKLRRVRRGA